MVVGAALFLFSFYTIYRTVYQISTNLKIGRKTFVRGIITDRYVQKELSLPDEDDHRSETKKKYLTVGNQVFVVNAAIYLKYKILFP